MGDERLAQLAPSTDPQQSRAAARRHERGDAAYLARHGLFPLRAPAICRDILASLAVEGRALEPLRLLALAASSNRSRTSRARHPPRGRGSFPLLDAASGGVASFKGEIARRARRSIPSGDVADDASPELRVIRDRLRKQRTRLRGTLESYLRGKETAKYLQEQVVTERNGRYVLVVRAEHRSNIPGIVHGASTSGASLFLEPLSTVEINNDIVALEEQEAEEVRRILLALTERLSRARRRPAADDGSGHRSRRAAGAGALFAVDRRHRAGALDRRRVRAAGRAASAPQGAGAGHRSRSFRRPRSCSSRGPIPAARRSRSKRPAFCR